MRNKIYYNKKWTQTTKARFDGLLRVNDLRPRERTCRFWKKWI